MASGHLLPHRSRGSSGHQWLSKPRTVAGMSSSSTGLGSPLMEDGRMAPSPAGETGGVTHAERGERLQSSIGEGGPCPGWGVRESPGGERGLLEHWLCTLCSIC